METIIGYRFRSLELYNQAVTHKSFGPRHNERLEFLGDAILSAIVAEDVYRQFPRATEGQLANMKNDRVNNARLAELARKHKLGRCIIMSRSELMDNGQDKQSILSDAVEALIGAAYLDGGFNAAQRIVRNLGI